MILRIYPARAELVHFIHYDIFTKDYCEGTGSSAWSHNMLKENRKRLEAKAGKYPKHETML